MTMLAAIDLERLAREFRTQRIVFETARDVYDGMQADWGRGRERGPKRKRKAARSCSPQLVRLVEQFVRSDRIVHRAAPVRAGTA